MAISKAWFLQIDVGASAQSGSAQMSSGQLAWTHVEALLGIFVTSVKLFSPLAQPSSVELSAAQPQFDVCAFDQLGSETSLGQLSSETFCSVFYCILTSVQLS
jgi:hypothetical protein